MRGTRKTVRSRQSIRSRYEGGIVGGSRAPMAENFADISGRGTFCALQARVVSNLLFLSPSVLRHVAKKKEERRCVAA